MPKAHLLRSRKRVVGLVLVVAALLALGILLALTPALQGVFRGARHRENVQPGAMVLLEGGTFTMGPPSEEARGHYGLWALSRDVAVKDFWIGKYPVTVREFCNFLNERGNPDGRYLYMYASGVSHRVVLTAQGRYEPRAGENVGSFPAVDVTWYGAVEYCRWLSERTGRPCRLPTEAEWEYAARGREGRKYPWGDEEPIPEGMRHKKSAGREFGLEVTFVRTRVGSFPRSDTPQGVADMLSRRWEWCSDAYEPDEGEREKSNEGRPIQFPDPCHGWSGDASPWHILRGFGEVGTAEGLLFTRAVYTAIPAWTRWACPPTTANGQIGFRVAADAGGQLPADVDQTRDGKGKAIRHGLRSD